MLQLSQIKELIDSPKNKELLERAVQLLKKHSLHVAGIGLDSYVDKIQGVENKDAVSLRRALGKVITQPELNKIISIQNKIFSARGGGRFYEFSNDRDKETFRNNILKNVKTNMSLNSYMSKIWHELVNIDSMGILLTEIKPDGELELSYKSSDNIHDIDFDAATKINYIIFKPVIVGTDKLYRVYDETGDYIIKYNGKEATVLESESFTNPWGFIPACFISDRMDKKSNGYTTHIEEAMIYADDILLDYTIYKIYKVKMGIPYHWQYEAECATCEGSGYIFENDEKISCTVCGGSGYMNKTRDVAEMLILPIPEDGDIPLTPPAGYVQADLQTWKQYEETIDRQNRLMYAAIWGESSTIETDRRNITASELTVREFSKENKLNEISDNEENVEQFITDVYGLFYYPGTYKGSVVNNGRIFDIKTPTELMSDYLNGLEKGLSTTELNEILESYYYSIYSRNPKKLNAARIKLKLKPFFHWQPEKLQTANVNQQDYAKNIYFDEFVVFYENTVEEIGLSTYDKVKQSFDNWIQEKIQVQEINVELNTNNNE